MIAPDPDFETRTRKSFARQPVMGFLGVTMSALQPGYCRLELPFRMELTQQHGFFHAGIVATLADNAGGYAGYSLMPPDSSVLSVELKINFMAPADGELLVAEGVVKRSGKNLTVAGAEVYVLKAGKRTHCATALQTLMCMHQVPEREPR